MEPGLCLLHGDPFKYQTILQTPLLTGFSQELTFIWQHNVCSTSTHRCVLPFPKGRPFPGVRRDSINISKPNGNQGHCLMALPEGRRDRQTEIKITESLWTGTFTVLSGECGTETPADPEVLPRSRGMQQVPVLHNSSNVTPELPCPSRYSWPGQTVLSHLVSPSPFRCSLQQHQSLLQQEMGSSEPGEAVLPFTKTQFNFFYV